MQDAQLQRHAVAAEPERVVHVFDDQLRMVADLDDDPVSAAAKLDGAWRGFDADPLL
jgi:hypothetical protein